MKELESRRRYVFDLETDGLLEDVTIINCIVIKDIDTGGVWKYPPDKVKIGLLRLYNAKMLICHNEIGYDLEVIRKLYPRWKTGAKLYDTLLLSQMFWPDISGSHGLEAWGNRLGVEKPKITEWAEYNEDILHRCTEDVKINSLLWLKCKKEMDSWPWEEAIELEHKVAHIHVKQVAHGFYFNHRKAMRLLCKLNKLIELIDFRIKPLLPVRCMKLYQGKEVALIFKKDGTYRHNIIKYFGDEGAKKVRGPYSRVSFPRIDVSSSDQLKRYFLRVGWKPDTWNSKRGEDGQWVRTSPKLTLTSLESSNITSNIGKDIVHRMMLTHRRNIISSPSGKGLLPHVREDGRIASEAVTIGTPTARYRHKVIANFPRVSTPYGKEIRDLFGVSEGKIQVGIDLSGIEMREACHYSYNFTGGEEMAYDVCEGDYHQRNADAWMVSRDTAKSGLYATLFGAGGAKLAATLMKPTNQGAKYIKAFYNANPALKELKDAVEDAIKSNGGFVKGLDGRKIFIRAAYRGLNSLFQSAAAIVFKRWAVMMDEAITELNLDVNQMTLYHDEGQFECSFEHAECFMDIASKLALKAGAYYKMKVPTPAKGKLGYSWKDCH